VIIVFICIVTGNAQNAYEYVINPTENITLKYNWTNAQSAWKGEICDGQAYAFLGNTSYEHQPSTCFGHDGKLILGYGKLSNGILWTQFPECFAGYLIAWHTPNGFVLVSGANRDALEKPKDSDYCVTYWFLASDISDLEGLTNANTDLLRSKGAVIDRLDETIVPSGFVQYFWFDADRLYLLVAASDYTHSIEINTLDWKGDEMSRRRLVLPLERTMWLPMADINKTVVYFGVTKIYAERR
jgi:hypothetical protein